MDPMTIGRRVRAARAYAGYNRAEDLAREIGIGRTTLLEIESGKREANRWILMAIAEITGLPYALFTDEFEDLMDAVEAEQRRRTREAQG